MSVDLDCFAYRRYSCTRQVVADWGDRLAQLRGRRLLSAHAQWESAVPSPEGWWVDGHVVLNFEWIQLELAARCHEFSVSVDTYGFDPTQAYGDDGESSLVVWRDFPWPELERFRDQPLGGLAAVEGHFEDLSKFKGLSLQFATGNVCFFDAGDELGLSWGPLPDDPTLRWTLSQQF